VLLRVVGWLTLPAALPCCCSLQPRPLVALVQAWLQMQLLAPLNW
jgi:hypothetical protein